ncbi:peroxide stress protein YaaA [Aliiglaciecola aliphaticivorans]
MLVVVSPAKNLDYETPPTPQLFSEPEYLPDSDLLIKECVKLSPAELSSLMHISDKLAGLNAARFSSWSLPFTPDNAKQAILAFNGDVYSGIQAEQFSQQDLEYAQQHMRILSGLYGLLKPLDLMQPYRLEMGTKLANLRGKNLYEFWGDKITLGINDSLQQQGDNVLVNLASNEYFKSVKMKNLKAEVITPVFKDKKNGEYKVISFYAKKARGLMARYIIEKRLSDPEQIKQFDAAGYQYSASQSNDKQWVFTREEQ